MEDDLAAGPTTHRTWRWRVTAGAAAAAVLALTLALAVARVIHGGPYLVPAWDIFLGYAVSPTLRQLAPALICLGLYALGARLLAPARGWLFVLWTLLGGIAIPAALLSLTGDPLGQWIACTLSKTCSGGYRAAIILSPAVLHNWPAYMPGMLVPLPHMSVLAPGWPLVFAGAFELLGRFPHLSARLAQPLRDLQCFRPDVISLGNARLAGAWLGLATPLSGALTVVPIYYLGQRLAGPRPARIAAAWWPLVPALALYPGSVSIPNPLLAAVVVALFYAGMAAERRGRAAALLILAGIAAGLALVLSLALLPVLALCGLFGACLALGQPPRARAWPALAPRLRRLFVAGLLAGLGLVAVYAAYRIALGHSLADVMRATVAVHLLAPHPYFKGLGLDAWDYIMYAGLPLAGLALIYPAVRRKAAPMTALALATGLTLLVLNLSGIARNEIGRVWMFFTPFVLLVAAATLAELDGRLRALAAAAQIAWLLAMATTWWPWHVELYRNPSYQEVAPAPLATPLTPAGALFDDQLRLRGFQSRYVPETRTLLVALHWQALAAAEAPQRFSGVLVGPDGRTLPGVLWDPLAGRYPTTCWLQGQGAGGEIVDQVAFPLGEAAQAGDWWLSLRAFTVAGDEMSPPLPVVLAGGAQDTQAGLGPLTVPP